MARLDWFRQTTLSTSKSCFSLPISVHLNAILVPPLTCNQMRFDFLPTDGYLGLITDGLCELYWIHCRNIEYDYMTLITFVNKLADFDCVWFAKKTMNCYPLICVGSLTCYEMQPHVQSLKIRRVKKDVRFKNETFSINLMMFRFSKPGQVDRNSSFINCA